MSIENTLAERGERYGKFEDHAVIAQDLQDVMRRAVATGGVTGWTRLSPDQKQALTVIADKIARILNGDPDYRDNWHDIVGYAKLIDDRLLSNEAATLPVPPQRRCTVEQPAGWTQCTRADGHSGPCAIDELCDPRPVE